MQEKASVRNFPPSITNIAHMQITYWGGVTRRFEALAKEVCVGSQDSHDVPAPMLPIWRASSGTRRCRCSGLERILGFGQDRGRGGVWAESLGDVNVTTPPPAAPICGSGRNDDGGVVSLLQIHRLMMEE
jgi:hypothetical protein